MYMLDKTIKINGKEYQVYADENDSNYEYIRKKCDGCGKVTYHYDEGVYCSKCGCGDIIVYSNSETLLMENGFDWDNDTEEWYYTENEQVRIGVYETDVIHNKTDIIKLIKKMAVA